MKDLFLKNLLDGDSKAKVSRPWVIFFQMGRNQGEQVIKLWNSDFEKWCELFWVFPQFVIERDEYTLKVKIAFS
jgi:hypothetical protein